MKQMVKNFFVPTLQNRLKPYSLSFPTLFIVATLTLLTEMLFYMYAIAARYKYLLETTANEGAVDPVAYDTALGSYREVFGNTLLVILTYVILVVIVPMIVIFLSHCSNNWSLRVREIFMLFKDQLRFATWVSVIIIIIYIFNNTMFDSGMLLMATQ